MSASSLHAVSREIVADTLTPVAAFATVGTRDGSWLLESVVGGEKWGRYSFVGFDPELLVRAERGEVHETHADGRTEHVSVDDPWAHLRSRLATFRAARAPELPRFWGGAVGFVAYEAVRRFEPHVGPGHAAPDTTPEFEFAVGGTVLVFDSLRQTVRVVVPARVGEDAKARAKIDHAIALLREPARVAPLAPPDPRADITLPASSFEPSAFRAAVTRAQEHIRAGDIFQVVLAQQFRQPADVDLFDVYRTMRVLNPSPYMFYLRFPGTRVAGASPETLVRVEDGEAEVRPIAGTRGRGRDEAEDARIAEELLADPKELAEHVMLVDLGRNDLGRIAKPGTVRVTERLVVERYSHVMHLVSNVRAELEAGRDALDVLRATFPAGTLSGAPKVRAMQILDALEPVRRGLYGGAVGYVGFDGNMDLAIAIRTVVERDGVLQVQAGAGVVEASDPQSEYDESLRKARAALLAVEHARRARRT